MYFNVIGNVLDAIVIPKNMEKYKIGYILKCNGFNFQYNNKNGD